MKPTHRTREGLFLGPEDLQLMFKFATTIMVVPTTGQPMVLLHFGLGNIDETELSEIHNVVITEVQLDSVISDLQKVQRQLKMM